MRDILFVGEVLASVTHDMQNVMAIIKESGALTDDILKLNGPPRLKHGDKLVTALTNIQEQVGRGRNLMLMLNGFAHSAADFPESGDLARFAKQISVLADRMVRLKECVLRVKLDGPPRPVRGNALMLMQSIYLGLAAMLATCAPGAEITLELPDGRPEGRTVARIRATPPPAAAPDTAALLPVLEEIGALCSAGPGLLDLRYQTAPGGLSA